MKMRLPNNKDIIILMTMALFIVLCPPPSYASQSESIVITVKVDGSPPVIGPVLPTPDAIIDVAKPLIQAKYTDGDGAGIDTSSVKLLLDGQDVTASSAVTASSVSYTPSDELTDEVHTAEVSLKDLLGHPASTRWSFRVYTGVLVGPEGGTVTSPDGKITVIIPPGALSQATKIRIVSADISAFAQDELPENHTLAIAGEFRPIGHQFNKDVQIIFTPDAPEVPGTEVALYLYNKLQGKFVSTGLISAIQTDGITVSFFIDHFSTYGALKSSISQGTPFGSGIKIPVPDMFTGAFGHPIQIAIPPGRKGVQPNLTLQYRSSNSNSWLGFGWDINPGYIVRSTKLGPPTYDDQKDTFLFVSDEGSTEMVHLVDNLYQARIESSFAKFFKESDDSWKVINKGGTTLLFGTTSDSKETSDKGTFAWYLTKLKDTNSNYIALSYTKDQAKSYLSHIEYTGNEGAGTSPKNRLEFFLEQRDDAFSNFSSSSKITTAKRLKEIQARCNGELVYRYELEYEYSPDTNRSLLKRVRTYTQDNKEFPTQEFSYQRAR